MTTAIIVTTCSYFSLPTEGSATLLWAVYLRRLLVLCFQSRESYQRRQNLYRAWNKKIILRAIKFPQEAQILYDWHSEKFVFCLIGTTRESFSIVPASWSQAWSKIVFISATEIKINRSPFSKTSSTQHFPQETGSWNGCIRFSLVWYCHSVGYSFSRVQTVSNQHLPPTYNLYLLLYILDLLKCMI